jgi:isoquinoline 1-oxidoreductase beta subunit
MNRIKSESRRNFLKTSAVLGGGLVIGFHLPERHALAQATPAMPNAWVKIAPDNTITLMCARSEMGQDVYTSMSMLIAEELEVDVNKVKIEFAPPAEPYINALLGGQVTGGSTSVRDAWEKLRKAGASARMMLVAAAAAQWNAKPAECKAANAAITGPGGKRLTYGQVAAAAAKLEPPKDVPLKPVKDFKVIGDPKQKRLDTPAKVRGETKFGIDTRVPGMLYAAVAMPAAFGGKVKSFDATRAKAVPGVKAVVQYSRGVAVVADSYWQAKKAKDLLQITWDPGPHADMDMKKIWDGLREALKKPGAVFREAGNVDTAMSGAAKRLTSTFELPFVSHSPMEPMNTTAHVTANKALIITPTQFQQLIPAVVSAAVGLKPEQVEVQTTFLGGGFGRRVDVDYAVDAAEISKAAGGVPVKMVWSREDDMTHDVYRPGGIYVMSAGLDAGGKPAAFRFHSASPSISSRAFPSIVKDGIDPFSVEGIDNFPYAVPNMKLTYQIHDTGVTVGYWRSVSHNLNAYALEVFVDEMAKEAGKDPLEYRLAMLDLTPSKHNWSGLSAGVAVGARMKKVLEVARERSGWGKPLPKGQGRGVAVMEGYNTVTAMVAEIAMTSGFDVAVNKVTAVVDAGPLIHPDQALAQVQGCIHFGLSSGLYEEITFKNGAVEQNNFDNYRVLRMNEGPRQIDIVFLPAAANQPPGGLGEPGTAVIVPAVANAIYAVTGKRVRKLPLTPENIAAA